MVKIRFSAVKFVFLMTISYLSSCTKDEASPEDAVTEEHTANVDSNESEAMSAPSGSLETADEQNIHQNYSAPQNTVPDSSGSDENSLSDTHTTLTDIVNPNTEPNANAPQLVDQPNSTDSMPPAVDTTADAMAIPAAPEPSAETPSLGYKIDSQTADSTPPPLDNTSTNHVQMPTVVDAPVSEINPGAPTLAQDSYVVQKGDTLGTISQKVYGTAKKWRQLAAINGINDPSKLRTGTSLKTSAPDQANDQVQTASAASSSSVTSAPNDQENSVTTGQEKNAREQKYYVIKKGDTLGHLALELLGTSKAWPKLWKNNQSKIKNPDKIFVGQKIKYLALLDRSTDLKTQESH